MGGTRQAQPTASPCGKRKLGTGLQTTALHYTRQCKFSKDIKCYLHIKVCTVVAVFADVQVCTCTSAATTNIELSRTAWTFPCTGSIWEGPKLQYGFSYSIHFEFEGHCRATVARCKACS